MFKHEGIVLELSDWAEWLARDKDGDLYAFSREPKKGISSYHQDGRDWAWVHETDDTFKLIRWEDEKPTRITDFIASMKKEADPLHVVTNDMVDRPTHYKNKNGQDLFQIWYERYDMVVFREVMRCVAERYISRYEKKNGLVDLQKGIYTLERLAEYERLRRL